jgi:HK97 family phage prohead protease
MEKRTFEVDKLEVRKTKDGKRTIKGHAAVFNRVADGGWFREKVAPGAFKDSIVKDDVRALWNHDPNFVLGRNTAGTLRLFEDEKGLAIEIDPPDTQSARDLLISIERGDVSQMSFGFSTIKDSWERIDGDKDIRTLEKVQLWDVSPVTFPFYKDTDVAVRSHEEWQKQTEQEAIPPAFRNKLRRKKLRIRKFNMEV